MATTPHRPLEAASPRDSAGASDGSGFRLRGLRMIRIETFTDAAFAFALTLLVVSLEPPTSFDQLAIMLSDVPAFILSASLLMMFWAGHNEWSRRYGLDDTVTYLLSALLVFTVLIYVYPLRFVFGLLVEWIGRLSGLPIGSGRIQVTGAADINDAFLVYGLGFVAMCAILVALHGYAWRRREQLALDPLERLDTRAAIGSWSIVGGVGLLSTVIAATAPDSWAGAPGWAYMLLPALMPAYGSAMNRRRARIADE